MVTGKRAQFFLLAAVIISAVVISLGVTTNKATVNKEPGNFYDFSYEMKREIGAVVDYEIYRAIPDSANLTEFVSALADEIREQNPDANFVVLYGNSTNMTLNNYGSKDAFFNEEEIPGASEPVFSTICTPNAGCETVYGENSDFIEGAGSRDLGAVGDSVNITVEGYDFDFPIYRHRQVIFIMQKGVGDESFVAIG